MNGHFLSVHCKMDELFLEDHRKAKKYLLFNKEVIETFRTIEIKSGQ